MRFAKLNLTLVLIIVALVNAFPGMTQVFVDQPRAEMMTGSRINDVAWNPDNEFFAVASSSGTVLYNQTLQQIASLNQGVETASLSWNPSGDLLAVTNQNVVEIWQWSKTSSTFDLISSLTTENPQVYVSWRPDLNGTQLATLEVEEPESFGGSTLVIGSIHIWNTETWQLARTITDQYIFDRSFSYANVLDWNSQGLPLLVGVGNGGRILNGDILIETDVIAYIINVETDERVQEIPLLGSKALSVAWQPSGTLIIVGSEATVDLYDTATGQYVDSFAGTNINVEALDWTSDGRIFVSSNTVVDVPTGQILGYFGSINVLRWFFWNESGWR